MKKSNKKIISAILTIISLLLMSTTVFATDSILGRVDPHGDIPSGEIKTMIGSLLGMVKAFANACAIGMLLYVGIKYTMASANEKADLKNSSIKYVAGAIIVFAATSIFTVIETLMTDIGSGL